MKEQLNNVFVFVLHIDYHLFGIQLLFLSLRINIQTHLSSIWSTPHTVLSCQGCFSLLTAAALFIAAAEG